MAECSDLIDNMATGKVSTRRHIFTHKHFSTNPHILSSGYHMLHLFVPLFCCTSVSSRLCTLNFYIIQIYEQSESPVPSRTSLSCRRAGLIANSLQRFRAVACSDFEIIELKQQFCGNRQTYTHTHTNQLSTVTLCPRGEG